MPFLPGDKLPTKGKRPPSLTQVWRESISQLVPAVGGREQAAGPVAMQYRAGAVLLKEVGSKGAGVMGPGLSAMMGLGVSPSRLPQPGSL